LKPRVKRKRNNLEESERRFIYEGGRKSILLKGTQAMRARPSDKDIRRVKTLGWWVVNAWHRDGRIWFHDSLLNVEII
jgi:hypothetical protein